MIDGRGIGGNERERLEKVGWRRKEGEWKDNSTRERNGRGDNREKSKNKREIEEKSKNMRERERERENEADVKINLKDQKENIRVVGDLHREFIFFFMIFNRTVAPSIQQIDLLKRSQRGKLFFIVFLLSCTPSTQ